MSIIFKLVSLNTLLNCTVLLSPVAAHIRQVFLHIDSFFCSFSFPQHHDYIDRTLRAIVERSLHGNNLLPDYVMSMRHELNQHDCYMQAVDHLHGNCMRVSNVSVQS